jgi:hypothetical protein
MSALTLVHIVALVSFMIVVALALLIMVREKRAKPMTFFMNMSVAMFFILFPFISQDFTVFERNTGTIRIYGDQDSRKKGGYSARGLWLSQTEITSTELRKLEGVKNE